MGVVEWLGLVSSFLGMVSFGCLSFLCLKPKGRVLGMTGLGIILGVGSLLHAVILVFSFGYSLDIV